MGNNKQSATQKDDDTTTEMSEKEIDANLEQTFPASDPPSWTLGTDHNVSINEEDEKDRESNQ